MPIREAVLAFYVPESIAAVEQLIEQSGGRGFATWFDVDPQLTTYVMQDEDYQHIATAYHALPTAVPVRVLTFLFADGDMTNAAGREFSATVERQWTDLCINHGVHFADYPLAGNDEYVARLERQVAVEIAFSRNPCAEIRLGDHLGASGELVVPRNTSAFRQNNQLYTVLVNRRQAEESSRRRQAAEDSRWVIDWNSDSTWSCPGPPPQRVTTVWPITAMEDKHLWETICWVVDNAVPLFKQYARPDFKKSGTMQLDAYRWISQQTALRAMVQEAIRRRLTFPMSVFRFLKGYLAHEGTPTVTTPWSNPADSYQVSELAAFLLEPTRQEEAFDAVREYGRELRDITL